MMIEPSKPTMTPMASTAAPPADAVRRRKTWGWGVTLWLMVMMIISWADKGIIGLAAVPIMHDLGISPAQFGFIGSSLFFLFCVTPIAVGFLGNRISTRWILAVLVLCWSIAQVPVLIAATVPALLGSRIALGAAEGPTTSMVVHHIYKWFPHRERALPGAVAAAGSSLGLAVAAPVLTFVIVRYGWQAAFGVLGAVGFLWVLVLVFVGKDGPFTTYEADTAPAGTPAASATDADPKTSYWRIFRSGTWWGGVVGGHVSFWAVAISAAWLPAYLERGLGYSLAKAGSIVWIPAMVGFVGMIGAGALCRTLLERGVSGRWACGVLQGGIAVICGVALLLATVTSPGALQIALLSVGFGLPISGLNLANVSAAQVSPVRQRSAVISFSVIGFTCAGIFAPTVAGAMIGSTSTLAGGFHHVMLLVGALLVAGGLTAALAIRPERDARRLGLPMAANGAHE